jgi:protein-S-isoprenylcysteine O-methyltransferase Ste14
MSGNRPLPPTYLLLGLVAMAVLHFALPGPRIVPGAWRLIGLPLIVGGIWLSMAAHALFKRHGTEIKPFKASRVLVTEGPFRFSRHPMYMGFLAILTGAALLAGTLVPLLGLGVMVWLFTAHFVIPEERHMEEQFGDQYREYKRRVRRWL